MSSEKYGANISRYHKRGLRRLRSLIRVRHIIGANGAEIRENERNLSLGPWFAKLISPRSTYPIYPRINSTRNESERVHARNRYIIQLCVKACAHCKTYLRESTCLLDRQARSLARSQDAMPISNHVISRVPFVLDEYYCSVINRGCCGPQVKWIELLGEHCSQLFRD